MPAVCLSVAFLERRCELSESVRNREPRNDRLEKAYTGHAGEHDGAPKHEVFRRAVHRYTVPRSRLSAPTFCVSHRNPATATMAITAVRIVDLLGTGNLPQR